MRKGINIALRPHTSIDSSTRHLFLWRSVIIQNGYGIRNLLEEGRFFGIDTDGVSIAGSSQRRKKPGECTSSNKLARKYNKPILNIHIHLNYIDKFHTFYTFDMTYFK